MLGSASSELFSLCLRVTALSLLSYATMKLLLDVVDPQRRQRSKAKEHAASILKGSGLDLSALKLTEHELSIAANLIDPSSLNVQFSDVAGLDDMITDLKHTLIRPLKLAALQQTKQQTLSSSVSMSQLSELTQAPRGVLLHGPPGCGKTLLARAAARDAGARFIHLDASALADKWYGESPKLASAVFTLAEKLQPCILFVDEIDALLRTRDSQDHEATAMMKSIFMQKWDGLTTKRECNVVLMGATNRPRDVDKAILRRMPNAYHIGLPSLHQRLAILKRILRDEALGPECDLHKIATFTEDFAGSDLKEVCRNASVNRLRDVEDDEEALNIDKLRPLSQDDLLNALRQIRVAKVHYGTAQPFVHAPLE